MEEKRKQLRRLIKEFSLDERIMEMRSLVEDVETASNNKYHYISENSIQTLLDKAREEGKLEVLEELLEWDTPLEPIGKFMRLQTKMVHMKKDLISKLTTK